MRGAVLIATLALATSACHSSGRPPATRGAPTSISVTTTSAPSTTSGVQTSGVRTVLSPGGLNIRALPARSAPVRGTAAQGTELTVLGHTDQGGGWFQVKGSTLTGWISDNRVLSAPGKFTAYFSTEHQFAALYPVAWAVADVSPATVVFHPPIGRDTVVVTNAPTVAQLSRGRAAYRQSPVQEVVVCGVTASFVTYTQASAPPTAAPPTAAPPTAAPPPGGVTAERYLIQVHLTFDPQHALGIDANLADLSQLQTFRDLLSSVKFPFPQCQQ